VANPNGHPETLKSYKPGQSGNPSGRPKGKTVTGRLRELLQASDDEPKKARTNLDKLAETIMQKAIEGHPRFVEIALGYLEGKPPVSPARAAGELGDTVPYDENGEPIDP
jgi:uncharacterized protein DUF5681